MISYAQNMEDVILARVFSGKTDGFYVDIGAMDPVKHSVTKHFYDLGWRGVNVEPNPVFYEKLRSSRPRDRNVACCISDVSAEVQFHIVGNEGHSTLDADLAERLKVKQLPQETILVQARRLAEVLEPTDPEIDFLKIDVEGLELQVLRGNDWSRYRPVVAVVEALDAGTLQPSWEPWDPELTGNGYRFVYFDGLNRFYLREDRLDLESRFASPPNVLDNFVTAAEVEWQRTATGAQTASQGDKVVSRIAPIDRGIDLTPYPSHAQAGEDRILLWIFEALGCASRLRYADVGATNPVGHNNTYLFYGLEGSGLLVEADPQYLPAYAQVRPRDAVEQVAIVPQRLREQNIVPFYVLRDRGWSTISSDHAELGVRLGKGVIERTLDVPCMTLNEVLEKHFPDGALDLLSIDIGGLQSEAIAELDLERFRPIALVVEGRCDEPRMRSAGYEVFASTFINTVLIRTDCLARLNP